MTPLTGDAGFLGNEQLSWAKYAVKTLAPKYGLKIQLLQGDTQLSADLAPRRSRRSTSPTRRSSRSSAPSTSGAVQATSQTLFQAGIAHISPSATRTALTKGANKQATPGFFRVVPDDDIQGPADALYMVDKLKAKKVVVVDSQEPYSVGLANAIERDAEGQGRHDPARVGQHRTRPTSRRS